MQIIDNKQFIFTDLETEMCAHDLGLPYEHEEKDIVVELSDGSATYKEHKLHSIITL